MCLVSCRYCSEEVSQAISSLKNKKVAQGCQHKEPPSHGLQVWRQGACRLPSMRMPWCNCLERPTAAPAACTDT